MSKAIISINVDRSVIALLKIRAKDEDRSVSWLANRILAAELTSGKQSDGGVTEENRQPNAA